MIADDTVAAYEAFTSLFAPSSFSPRVRSLLERRREMLAWQMAVAINTGASFDVFLASYPNSDLAITARTMHERVLNRSFGVRPTTLALAPTCLCGPAPTPAPKKADKPPLTKRVETTTPKRRAPGDGPPPDSGPPGPVMQGIGIGIGLGGGGFGGGSPGGRGGGGSGGYHR